MARVLMAWELGANLGHLTRLRPVATALQRRGHTLSFALRDVMGSRAVLPPGLGRVFQAPLAIHTTPTPAWTMADVLVACGHGHAAGLAGLAAAWQSLIEVSGCEVLIADHAPTALLAARVMGVPAVHIGHGFSVPPRLSPLPVFRDWAPPPAHHAADVDAQVLSCVNTVLRDAGAAPLDRLCDLFYPERTLLCTWPELDHYGGLGRSAADYVGPDGEYAPGAEPDWPGGNGPHVLAYLRRSHPGHVEVLRALADCRLPTLCYLPGEGAEPVSAPTLRYSRQPIDFRRALPRCSLLVCHAGQATVAQALRLGIPVLMLPEHAEQHLIARQVERSGAGVNAALQAPPVAYASLIEIMVRADGSHAKAARAVAKRHSAFDPAALTARIVEAAESVLT
ncbi:glycosyltransferase [Piscinibacter sp. HJYY11]|uniref:glycosyltransferase n=1 Tax=Piscinibacter sp. HJYY11 TaxID=2801333 RepID=UPI00191F74C1|nr:nucleotide disphospho-sugar-binding domain-containing protein [Piscinibacter sp. HJYY11]MBL0727841.1 UDP-glucuronosyltransferase [Piscinibacter sp. HJYY11]